MPACLCLCLPNPLALLTLDLRNRPLKAVALARVVSEASMAFCPLSGGIYKR